MTIRAKYRGTCATCGGEIEPGQLIEWVKGGSTRHDSCPAETPVVSRTREFAPTDEQMRALDLFGSGRSLKIEAGAGTGKTSTLVLLAESTERRGQYLAFNRAIVRDSADRFPRRVSCSTAHSLAYRSDPRFPEAIRTRARRLRATDVVGILGIDAIGLDDRVVSATYLAGYVLAAVRRFCQSADETVLARHFPTIKGIDEPGSYVNNNGVADAMLPVARAAWADLMSPRGRLRFDHDHYLKAWQLSGPRIGVDYVLFDEAQDANPVMVAVVAAQTHAQIVWVGDSQQQIYSFTGAVNALASIPADDTAYLTQSFRFGPAVADVANTILDRLPDAELRLVGTESIASVVAPVAEPDAILCRTNAEAVRTVLSLQRDGRRPALVGGGDEVVRFAKAARELQETGSTEHPELACFVSWQEVKRYVEEDEQGDDLRLLVKLVEDFGIDVILDALDRVMDERDADVIVSTAHKAKGREWEAVQLAADFPPPEKMGDEEWRLLYVAATRARAALDVEAVRETIYGTESGEPEEEGDPSPSSPAAPEEPAESDVDPLVEAGLPAEMVELLRRPVRPGDRFDLIQRRAVIATLDDFVPAVRAAVADAARGIETTVYALHADGTGDLVYEFPALAPTSHR